MSTMQQVGLLVDDIRAEMSWGNTFEILDVSAPGLVDLLLGLYPARTRPDADGLAPLRLHRA